LVVIVEQNNHQKKGSKSQLDLLKEEYKKRLKLGQTSPELYIVDGLMYPSPSRL
jgi:hypothetical protein